MSLCECGRRKISILRTGLSVTSRLATVWPARLDLDLDRLLRFHGGDGQVNALAAELELERLALRPRDGLRRSPARRKGN